MARRESKISLQTQSEREQQVIEDAVRASEEAETRRERPALNKRAVALIREKLYAVTEALAASRNKEGSREQIKAEASLALGDVSDFPDAVATGLRTARDNLVAQFMDSGDLGQVREQARMQALSIASEAPVGFGEERREPTDLRAEMDSVPLS